MSRPWRAESGGRWPSPGQRRRWCRPAPPTRWVAAAQTQEGLCCEDLEKGGWAQGLRPRSGQGIHQRLPACGHCPPRVKARRVSRWPARRVLVAPQPVLAGPARREG
eukprot:scaffold160651_cov28-Tisochrysis_lutea.AAC.2